MTNPHLARVTYYKSIDDLILIMDAFTLQWDNTLLYSVAEKKTLGWRKNISQVKSVLRTFKSPPLSKLGMYSSVATQVEDLTENLLHH